MTTSDLKEQRRKDIEKIRDELTRVRDELRVKMHLASMDAKDEWTKIEPTLDQIEHAWRDFSHEALNAAKTLRDRLLQVRARMDGHPREVVPPGNR